MSSFELLNRDIRAYIYNQGWPSLTKIQEAAIRYISTKDDNFILSARTASGKTEAAFLPAINAIVNWQEGVKIIYISPLIALINDQFERISDLCRHLDITVTSWHGEASRTQKKKLLEHPSGILMITPESIEAMLVLRSGEAKQLFKAVEFVIVDEIHGFYDNNRGVQLASLLERLQHYMVSKPRYIGMSATLDRLDGPLIKGYFHNGRKTTILADQSHNDLEISGDYCLENGKKESSEAVKKIYQWSQQEAMLVFPNSKRSVEYLSVNLTKMAKKHRSSVRYFAHHASLTKELRQSVERFAKSATVELFTICCTSTLEMGIDIGAVDSVVQYNAPHSVATLAQRLGRSGRHTKKSVLHFIATTPWDLLQGLATIQLYQERKIGQLEPIKKPYDVLAHQILSILLEHNGLPLPEFQRLITDQQTFSMVTPAEFDCLTTYLFEESYIEQLENDVITGIAVEPLLRGPDFYAQFVTETQFSVISDERKIGNIPLTPAIAVDVNIYLGAKVWKIIRIDTTSQKIIVKKATDGKPPIFLSGNNPVAHAIRQEMKQLLYHGDPTLTIGDTFQSESTNNGQKWADSNGLKDQPRVLDSSGDRGDVSTEMVEALAKIKEEAIQPDNPYLVESASRVAFRTYAGSKINQTILILLQLIKPDVMVQLDDRRSKITIMGTDQPIAALVISIISQKWQMEDLISYFERYPEMIGRFMSSVKYKRLLPRELQIRYICYNFLELEPTIAYLSDIAREIG